MKKFSITVIYLLCLLTLLSGCSSIGSKTASMSIIYGSTTIFSLLILLCYCYFIQKKDLWFLLIFSSVFVVNVGYFCLAISTTLEEALLANRISYFGSVFLPITMLMILLRVTKISYQKWVPGLLLSIGFVVFLIAASPGYSTLYYQSVTLEFVNGVTTLNKVYGPLHQIYFYYLLIHFSLMIFVTSYAIVKMKMESVTQSILLVMAVFVNLGVWFFEQLVKLDFEILSVSYIISELFLLGLHSLMLENAELKEVANSNESSIIVHPSVSPIDQPVVDQSTTEELASELMVQFLSGLKELTPTEKTIFHCYTKGKSTKEIMSELNIKENTLKFHNKNIYGKLGVSSRKQLLERHRKIEHEKGSTS